MTCSDPSLLGCLPPGISWDGNTPWVGESVWTTSNGIAVLAPNADLEDIAAQYGSDYDAGGNIVIERPDGPHNYSHAARLKVRFDKGSGTGGNRYVGYRWRGVSWENANIGGAVRLFPGDDGVSNNARLQVEGFAIDEKAFTAPIWDDGWWWVVVDFRNGVVKAKAWKDGEPEPGYQTSVTVGEGSDVRSSIELMGACMDNDEIEVEQIDVGGDPPPYRAVNNAFVGTGDGVTAEFNMPGPYLEGSAVVKVDGLVVLPILWTDGDPPTFTLDRPPDVNARVTVSYISV